MAEAGTDLPPPYYAVKDEATTEQNATEVTAPDSDDVPEIYGPMFEHKDNRIGFIQKVLAIKLLQSVATTIVMAVFVAGGYNIYSAMRYEPYTRIHLIVVSTLILVAILGLIHYCNKARFTAPYNYMFLVALPASAGFFTSVVTWGWALGEIFVSWVLFNLVVLVLLFYSVLALQTKVEFKTNICLFLTGGVLLVGYALTVPFVYVNFFLVLYCCLMMFALTAYMLIDIQAMMSKTYRIRLSPSDFVKAALIMHIDYRYMLRKFYNKHTRPHLNYHEDPPSNDAA